MRPGPVLLTAAGVVLAVAGQLDNPLVAVVALPAALLAPGQLLLGLATVRSRLEVDRWLVWALRFVLSVATWALVGGCLAVVPGDPRDSGVVIGGWLIGGGLLQLWSEQRVSPVHRSPGSPSVPARGRVVAVLAVGLVAATGYGGGFLVSAARAQEQPYLSLELDPPRGSIVLGRGRLQVDTLVGNHTAARVVGQVEVTVDGVPTLRRDLQVRAGGQARVPLAQLAVQPCWQRLTVTLTGVGAGLAPRPLTLYGPGSQPVDTSRPTIPATTPGGIPRFRLTSGCPDAGP